MMKVDQIVRCKTVYLNGIQPLGYGALRTGDKYKVNAINAEGLLQIIYLDDYAPAAFRKHWFDPSIFNIVPKHSPFKEGQKVILTDYSAIYNGRTIKMLVEEGTLAFYRPYTVLGSADGDTDIVRLITDGGYKFLIGIDAVKQIGIKNEKVPSWF